MRCPLLTDVTTKYSILHTFHNFLRCFKGGKLLSIGEKQY